MTLAFGFASAKLTVRRDKIDTLATAGEARHSARMAEPARPVAPVTMMWAMYAVIGAVVKYGILRVAKTMRTTTSRELIAMDLSL
jgi:hypothetical protein